MCITKAFDTSVAGMTAQVAQNGQDKWINTSSKRVRETYYNNSLSREHSILESFKKSNVDHANICIQSGYIYPLMNLFKKR